MSKPVDPRWEASGVALRASHRAEARAIADEIARIARSGEVLPGSIVERETVCGKPSCACKKDPPRRHGPYFQWTRKVAAKTVGHYLSAEQRDDYSSWIENDRRLRELVTRLEALGVEALEGDQRRPRRRRVPVDEV